jgi:hypothetical protein
MPIASAIHFGSDAARHMSILGLVDEPLGGLGAIRQQLWRWRAGSLESVRSDQ